MDATLPAKAPAANTLVLPPFGSRATSAFDDFNRANSTNMGSDWNEVAGDIEILNNQGHGLQNMSMMIHTSASVLADGSSQSIDFSMTTPGVVYVASVMGYIDTAQNIFIKVQDNNADGLYDRLFFYYGNNGSPWVNTTGYYFDLATPTASGMMVTTIQGDLAIVDIHNSVSGAIETFTVDGVAALAVGTEFGVGTYGSAYFDNYDLNGGLASPLLSVSAGAPGGVMTFDLENFTPSSLIAMVYGPTGAFLVPFGPCAGLVVDLVPMNFPPVSALITLFSDFNGDAQYTTPVPAAGTGLAVQAVDVATCVKSNFIVLGVTPGVTFDFPSPVSTVVGSVGFGVGVGSEFCGYFWDVLRGDMVGEVFTGPASISKYEFHCDVENGLNGGAQVDWDVVINGVLVDSFTVVQGQTVINEVGSFPAISGPAYSVELWVTNTVVPGGGSNALRYTGTGLHEITLQ